VLNPSTGVVPSQAISPALAAKPVSQGLRDGEIGSDWTIQEDWALRKAIMEVQELPLNLSSPSPGHLTNWDMVSDMVNAVSRCFRSGKHCKARYESTLIAREEGRIMYDVTPKKLKKANKIGQKNIEKKTPPGTLPTRQPMKTSALLKADNNNAFGTLFSGRFETIKAIANKRTPTTKPLLVNPTMRNPKHAQVLAESGITYDSPMSPIQVAANRAERIQRDKARTAQTQAQTPTPAATPTAAPALPQTPLAQQRVTQPAVLTPAVTAVPLPTAPAQAVVVGISQPLQQAAASGGVTRPVTALSVQDILKGNVVTTNAASGTQVQPVVTISSGARLPSGQIVGMSMSQATKAGTSSPTVQVAGRQLTQQQFQVLNIKQQQAKKSQQEQQQQQQKQRLATMSGASPQQQQVTPSGSKVTVAGGMATQRGQQVVKQSVRSMTEPEMKALLVKQQLKVGAGGGVVQVPAGTSLSSAQLQQLGIQVANPSSSAGTIVKTITTSTQAGQTGTNKSVTIAGVTGAVNLGAGQLKAVAAGRGAAITGSPQQVQQVQFQRQLHLVPKKNVGGGQRVAIQQVTGGKGVPAQLIVQPGGKGLPATVTVQQLQQIVKSVAGAGQGQQIITQAVLAKPGGQGQTVQARVIPVSATQGRQGQQTIQVVAAAPAGQRAAPNVTIDQLGRPQTQTIAGTALTAQGGQQVKIQAAQSAAVGPQQLALAGSSQAVRHSQAGQAVSAQPNLTRVQQPQMVNLQLSVNQANQQPQVNNTNQPNNNTE